VYTEADQGKTTKKLSIVPMKDGKGYFFTLTVSDKVENTNDSLSLPVSFAELAVIRSLIDYSIPKLLGFDELFANPSQEQQ
jgi:hypothetical protein